MSDIPLHASYKSPSPSDAVSDTSESSPRALRRVTRCFRSESVCPFSYAPADTGHENEKKMNDVY